MTDIFDELLVSQAKHVLEENERLEAEVVRLTRLAELVPELQLDYIDSYEDCIHCGTSQYPTCTNPDCPAVKAWAILEEK